MKLLLSTDGGGIRGIIPAIVVESLEAYTGKLARETVSFAAGTSTGALIAAAIARGVSGKQMREIYLNRTKELFGGWGPVKTLKRVGSGAMYSTGKLRSVLADVLPGSDLPLNSQPIDLMIPAVEVSTGHTWFGVKDRPQNARTTGTTSLLDWATASAAAPTYFSPYRIPRFGDFVDGGVGTNGNPSYQLCVEAFRYSSYDPKDTVLISLGTGRYPKMPQLGGTLLNSLQWTLKSLLQAPQEQQTRLVEDWWVPKGLRMYRYDAFLPVDVAMDDAGAVRSLVPLAERLAASINWGKALEGEPIC